MRSLTKSAVSAALLGAFDGSNTGLGLILGLVAGASASGMLKVAIPAAAAGAASMGLGELGSSNENGWREALAMALVWTLACLLLIFTGAFVPRPEMWVVAALELVSLGVAITYARDSKLKRKGLIKTLGIVAGTAAVAVAVAPIYSLG